MRACCPAALHFGLLYRRFDLRVHVLTFLAICVAQQASRLAHYLGVLHKKTIADAVHMKHVRITATKFGCLVDQCGNI